MFSLETCFHVLNFSRIIWIQSFSSLASVQRSGISKPRKHSTAGVHLAGMSMAESPKLIKPFTRKQHMPVRFNSLICNPIGLHFPFLFTASFLIAGSSCQALHLVVCEGFHFGLVFMSSNLRLNHKLTAPVVPCQALPEPRSRG